MKTAINAIIDLALYVSTHSIIGAFRNNRARMFLGNRNEYCTFWI